MSLQKTDQQPSTRGQYMRQHDCPLCHAARPDNLMSPGSIDSLIPNQNYTGLPLTGNSDAAMPDGLYLAVNAEKDGSYNAMMFIPSSAYDEKANSGLAQYLSQGGMQELVETMMQYATSAKTPAKEKYVN